LTARRGLAPFLPFVDRKKGVLGMNLLHQHSLIKFDRQFPVYNFFFPTQGKKRSNDALADILHAAQGYAASRALYFHIPFCDTICNFCPFTRGKYSDREVIDTYFESLLSEIRMKADLVDLKRIPIGAIFFDGGTPSLLDPDQDLPNRRTDPE
jgi:coproporphyrinogen III oxidase-like Fe-S oxidoreductase